MYRFGYRYRLVSLAFMLCGVLVLMFDHVNIVIPLMAGDPAIIAVSIIILGALLLILDIDKKDHHDADVMSKMEQLMDFKDLQMRKYPRISADQLESALYKYATQIEFQEFTRFLRSHQHHHRENKRESA